MTEILPGESYVTISTIVPLCKRLKNILKNVQSDTVEENETFNLLKNYILNIIDNIFENWYNFSDEFNESILKISITLDSRFKLDYVTTESKNILNILKLECIKIMDIAENEDAVEFNFNKRKKLQGLFSIFECDEDNSSLSTSLVRELKLQFLNT